MVQCFLKVLAISTKKNVFFQNLNFPKHKKHFFSKKTPIFPKKKRFRQILFFFRNRCFAPISPKKYQQKNAAIRAVPSPKRLSSFLLKFFLKKNTVRWSTKCYLFCQRIELPGIQWLSSGRGFVCACWTACSTVFKVSVSLSRAVLTPKVFFC